MLTTKEGRISGKLRFGLTAAVGLDRLRKAAKTMRHGKPQKGFSVCRETAGTQQHVGFTAEDGDCRESKDGSKMHGVHLNDLARCLGFGNRAALLVFALFGAQRIFFGQHFVNLRNRERDLMLLFQEVSDLLTAAIMFAFPDGRDKLLGADAHLTRRAGLLFGLLRIISKLAYGPANGLKTPSADF